MATKEEIRRTIENFIRDAYTNDLIVNFVGHHSEIKKFYKENYEQKSNIRYREFLSLLQQNYYISVRSRGITFSRKDVHELTKDLRRKQSNKSQQNGVKPTKNVCEVCFSETGPSHGQSDVHVANVTYQKHSESFTKNEDFQMKLEHTEFHENNIDDVHTLKQLVLSLTNIGKKAYVIKNVVLILQQPGLKISQIQGQSLVPEKSLTINIGGILEDDSTTILVCIITQLKNQTGLTYYLEDIPLDVVKDNDHRSTAIVRGVKPEDAIPPTAVPLKLKSFRVPRYFAKRLDNLASWQPDFVRRLNYETAERYSKWAKFLNIPTNLTVQNYTTMLPKILDVEENQMMVDIRVYDTVAKLVFVKTFYKQNRERVDLYSLAVPGLAESKPSLIRYDSVYARLEEKYRDRHKYEGIVHKVREAEVHLAFHNTFNSIKVKSANNQKFCIEFGFNRRPLKVEKQAVELVKRHKIAPFFFPKPFTGNEEQYIPKSFFNRSLNDEQKRAVQNILVKRPLPYLIFGPPGTGKTVTVVEAVLQIWSTQKNAKVLICTPSNDAADVVTKRLFDIIKNTTDICRFIGFLKSESSKKHYESDIRTVLRHKIVISTIINAARLVNGGVSAGHFDYVFIDESGYATESEALIPVAGVLSEEKTPGKIFGQLVLAGDPRQLGPRIHSTFAKFCGFGKSMLERLLDTCDVYSRRPDKPELYDARCVTKLLVNYRSHEAILKIPNDLFYNGDLIPANDNFSCLFTEWEGLKKRNFPVIFHHVNGEDKKDESSPSFSNDKEIKIVMEYVKELVKDTRVKGKTITQEDVGVITPYRRQMEKIQDECKKNNWKELKVGSVQQFQGKETIALIISTVRSKNAEQFRKIDQLYDLGLMNNPRRFNVALTRPKALVIVVGNGEILSTDRFWREFIQYCISNGSVKGDAFSMAAQQRFNVALTRPKALVIVVGNGEILSTDRFWREFIQYCISNGSVKGDAFSMAAQQRFNVALTRPKALVIVVGNGEILSTDRFWREFIQYCISNGSVKGDAFSMAAQQVGS